jgi:FkbM family methyltransferase
MPSLTGVCSALLRRLGYQITRIAPSHTPLELSGLTYEHFLQIWLMGQNLSDFFFVQIGAHNGITNDSLYSCVRSLGLRGLLIEPQPDPFQALQQNYAGCDGLILENVAIGHHTGSQPLYTIRRDLDFLQYANQAASFDRNHVQRLLTAHVNGGMSRSVRRRMRDLAVREEDCIEAQEVRTYRFEELLQKHRISGYDLLQIDTEGFDYEVIRLAAIGRYKPSMINYEHIHLPPATQKECRTYLGKLGYQMFLHGTDTTAYRPPASGVVDDGSLMPAVEKRS